MTNQAATEVQMNTAAYDAYTDAELDTVAATFAGAFEIETARAARLGFGNATYHLDALHGAALEINRRRETVEPAAPVPFCVRPRPAQLFSGTLLMDDTLAFYGTGPQEVMAWTNAPVR